MRPTDLACRNPSWEVRISDKVKYSEASALFCSSIHSHFVLYQYTLATYSFQVNSYDFTWLLPYLMRYMYMDFSSHQVLTIDESCNGRNFDQVSHDFELFFVLL
jgi:hypothetical protein